MSQTVKSLIALVISIIIVHMIYAGYIRPQADALILEAIRAGQTPPRHIAVILKDYEQEICLVLFLWGIYLISEKLQVLLKQRYLFNVDLLSGASSGSASMQESLSALDELPPEVRETPLVSTLNTSLRRYLITNNVQNTSDAIQSSVEALALRLDAENSMIRYLIWAIPSIGFIGTVRGIGQALSQADEALAGDITGMTDSLGVAFNSTFVALLISIVLMFLLTQLQRLQDDLVVDTQAYCEKFLLKRIGVRPETGTQT